MGRKQLFTVRLTPEERQQLTDMTKKGVLSARVMTRARLLLLSDQGQKDRDVADKQGVSGNAPGLTSSSVASVRR